MVSLTEQQEDDILDEIRYQEYHQLPWSFRPYTHTDQPAFVDSDGRRIILLGGNRSGKSECGAVKASRYMLQCPRKWDDDKPKTFWIVGETFEVIGETIWKPKLKSMLPSVEIASISYVNKAKDWPSMVRLKNGWDIIFKPHEQGREAFQGAAIRGCWCDEQCPEDILGEIFARCVDYSAPVWMTLTPINPDPFLEERYAEQPDGWEWYRLDIDDTRKSRGGHNEDSVVDDWLNEIPEQFYDTRKKGEFFGFQGAVYPGFNRRVHVCEPFDIPAGWERVCGIDFGFNNPFVCLWIAIDEDGDWYVFHEHRAEKRNIDYHAAQIQAVDEWAVPHKHNLTRFWDPGDTANVTLNGRDYRASGRAELRERGIDGQNAKKDIIRGIERLAGMLKVRENGEPRLHIFSSCKGLIREMASYRWPSKTKTGNKNPDDRPMKVDDHGPDALRYAVFSYKAPKTGRPAPTERRQNLFKRPESSFTRQGVHYG